MPDQINVKDIPNTPADESLSYMLGYIAGDIRRRSGTRKTSSDIVRELVRADYDKRVKRNSNESEATK
jgi:hypothetical protein